MSAYTVSVVVSFEDGERHRMDLPAVPRIGELIDLKHLDGKLGETWKVTQVVYGGLAPHDVYCHVSRIGDKLI